MLSYTIYNGNKNGQGKRLVGELNMISCSTFKSDLEMGLKPTLYLSKESRNVEECYIQIQ